MNFQIMYGQQLSEAIVGSIKSIVRTVMLFICFINTTIYTARNIK